MILEERYTYTVQPRRPIRNLIKGKVIMREATLQLTKEEVLQCMDYGAVYRKFYLETDMERVVPSNLDRLHRSVHLTEDKYKALLEKGQDSASGVSDVEGLGVEQTSLDSNSTSEPEVPVEESTDSDEEVGETNSTPEVEEKTEDVVPEQENEASEDDMNQTVEDLKKAEEEQLSTNADNIASTDATVEENETEGEEESEDQPNEEELEEDESDDSEDMEVIESNNNQRNYPAPKSGKKNRKNKRH